MSKETGEISENVKEVREKVDALWAHLQESERERIALLHHDLEKKCREAQAAQDDLRVKGAAIVEKENALAQAQQRLQRAHQAAEEWQQEAQRCQGLLREGGGRGESALAAECEEKARAIAELQQELQRVNGECSTFKVRQGTLEDEIDKRTSENAELRAELSHFASERADLQEQLQRRAHGGGRGSVELQEQLRLKDAECGQLHERLGAEMAALKHADHEKAELERRLGDAVARCQGLEAECRSLQGRAAHEEELQRRERELSEREARLSHQAASVEKLRHQRDEFEQQRQIAESDLERQRREMERQAREHREQCGRDVEQSKSQLQQQRDAFDQQRQMVEQDLERQRLELEQQARDHRHRGAVDDKETKALRQSVQDQKSAIFELQGQLSREQTLATFITPGEFIKMAKKDEADLGLGAHENAALKLKLSGLEMEVKEALRHNDALRKHVPAAAREALQKELAEQPPAVEAA